MRIPLLTMMAGVLLLVVTGLADHAAGQNPVPAPIDCGTRTFVGKMEMPDGSVVDATVTIHTYFPPGGTYTSDITIVDEFARKWEFREVYTMRFRDGGSQSYFGDGITGHDTCNEPKKEDRKLDLKFDGPCGEQKFRGTEK